MMIEELKAKYQNEVEEIECILEITDTTYYINTAVALAIDKAYKAIFKYTGWDTFNSDYMTALYSLAISYYNNDSVKYKSAVGTRLITQQSQGSRSATYAKGTIEIDSNGLTEDVKAMLPLPKLRCF